MTTKNKEDQHDTEAIQHLIRDAMRYRAIQKRIDYSKGDDGMTWATLNWCVDVHSLSPIDLDEAIDQLLVTNIEDQDKVVNNLISIISDKKRMDWLETQDCWVGITGDYYAEAINSCGGDYDKTVREVCDECLSNQ